MVTPQTHGSVLLVVSHRADLIGEVEGMGCNSLALLLLGCIMLYEVVQDSDPSTNAFVSSTLTGNYQRPFLDLTIVYKS